MTCRPGEPLTEGHTGGEGTSDAERREQRRHAAGDLVAQHRVQTPIQSQTRQKWSDTGNGDDERRDQSAAGHQTTGEAITVAAVADDTIGPRLSPRDNW